MLTFVSIVVTSIPYAIDLAPVESRVKRLLKAAVVVNVEEDVEDEEDEPFSDTMISFDLNFQ